MERLHIGSASRKTGIRARDDLRRDKYNMEDLDEFFDDDDKSTYVQTGDDNDSDDRQPNSGGRGTTRLVGIDGVARALDFNEAEADSFMLSSPVHSIDEAPVKKRGRPRKKPPVLAPKNSVYDDDDEEVHRGPAYTQYKSPPELNGKRTKKSPLRSPLQDTQTPRTEFNDNFEPELDPEPEMDDIEDAEQSLSPVKVPDTLRAGPPTSASTTTPTTSSHRKGYGSSLTKNMALGRPSKRKPAATTEIEIIDDDSIPEPEELIPSLDDSFNDTLYKDSQPTQTDTQFSTDSGSRRSTQTVLGSGSYPSPPPDHSKGVRKSARTRFKPLAFWKGERVVYSRVNESFVDLITDDPKLLNDLKIMPLQEIDEVSTEASKKPEPTVSNKKKTGNRGRKKKEPKKREEYDYESDPEIEGSEWYANKKLDLEVYADDKHKKMVDRTIVLGPGQVSETQKFDDQFDNCTLHTLFNDYVDYGVNAVLEFPIGGQKAMRTSGGAVMFIYVIKGLIHVTLNNDFFVVTKGCSLLIPAYNMYAFKNVGQTDAKLYISQTKVEYD